MALTPTKQSRASKTSRAPRPSEITTVNVFLIVCTALTGVLAWAAGKFVYTALLETMARPLLIGLVFVILYAMLGIVVFSISNLKGDFRENVISGGSAGGALLFLLAAGVVIFAAAALFQWLYGLRLERKDIGPTSYIFMIDDSESMLDSDPQEERYAAIPSVLAGMDQDFPYMVYHFSDDIKRIRDMGPISKGVSVPTSEAAGRTAIRGALSQVIADRETGVWEGGRRPKVILLTDGYATDMTALKDIDPVLKRFAAADICVSTIGLGQADGRLLERIAQKTGGVFVDVEEMSGLSDAMMSAVGRQAERDLLSAREMTGANVFYGALRVLFLTLLGVLTGSLMAVAYGSQSAVSLIAVSSVIEALAGALLMELGTAAGFPAGIMWLLLWILIALTVASKVVPNKHRNDRTPYKPGGRDAGTRDLSPY